MAKRRGNSEGSIYKDKDGRWRGSISIGIVDGKYRRKLFSGKTRREVAEKIERALQDLRAGAVVLDERQTVGQYMTRWLESRKAAIRPSTYANYEYFNRIWITPRIGTLKLASLSGQHVQAFIDEVVATGELSPKSVHLLHATLRAALNRAFRQGVVRQNAAQHVDLPKLEKHRVIPWTPEQVSQFLVAARGDKYEVAYYVALGAGLREGELAGMAWPLIDLDKGTIRVAQKIERVRGQGLQLSRPKSEAGEATLALPAIAVQKLLELRTTQRQRRLFAGSRWPAPEALLEKLVPDPAMRDQYHADLVFTTKVGTAVDPIQLYRHFNTICKEAGLPPRRFHNLRHDHASFLLALGASLKEIQASLRHSQIGLTADTYTHLLDAVGAENASKLDAFLREASGES